MQVQMIPVESSMFAAIGFNAQTEELYAQFKTGTLAAYGPTSLEEFDEVLVSDSVGAAFSKIIKPRKKYRKVEEEEKEIPVEQQQRGLDDGPANSIIQHDNLYVTPVPTHAAVEIPVMSAELAAQVDTLSTQAKELTITSQSAHVLGQEVIIAIGATTKAIKAYFKPAKAAADAVHAEICKLENSGVTPLTLAKQLLSEKLVAFEQQMERDRQAEQQRLRIEAQAAAEKAAKEEAERLAIEDAIALEAAGQVEAAAAVLANPVPIQPVYTPPVILPTTTSRVSGIVSKTTYTARVVNPALVPREWMVPDIAALNKFAASRGALAVVPGVEFVPSTSMHGRSR